MLDFHITRGIAEGCSEAAEALVLRYGRPLHRYFSLSLPDSSAAEDAAQEVFLRLVAMARDGRLEGVRSLDAVVFTIARRLAIDLKRSWSRRPPMRSLEGLAELDVERGVCAGAGLSGGRGPSPSEAAARSEQLELVESAIRELKEDVREVIVLRHLEGLTSGEVAEILGIAEGTVWSRLHRGLQILRKKLAARPVRPALSEQSGVEKETKR